MSRLTGSPMRIMPPVAVGHLLDAGASVWASGLWVEFFASTAQPTTIAGVVLQNPSTWSGMQWEIEFGIGAPGVEVAIGHIRLFGPNSGNGSPTSYLLETPFTGIGAGVRVCARLRAGGVPTNLYVNVIYYYNFDSTQAVPYSTVRLTSLPAGVVAPTLTPSGVDWTPSAWVESSPAVGELTHLVGLALSDLAPDVDSEFDIGIGAPGGEVVLTTLRSGTRGGGSGRLNVINLPGLYPVVEGQRVAVLMRQSGTNTQAVSVAILVYMGPLEEIGAPPGSGRYIRRWLRRSPVVGA